MAKKNEKRKKKIIIFYERHKSLLFTCHTVYTATKRNTHTYTDKHSETKYHFQFNSTYIIIWTIFFFLFSWCTQLSHLKKKMWNTKIEFVLFVMSSVIFVMCFFFFARNSLLFHCLLFSIRLVWTFFTRATS